MIKKLAIQNPSYVAFTFLYVRSTNLTNIGYAKLSSITNLPCTTNIGDFGMCGGLENFHICGSKVIIDWSRDTF